MADLFHPKAVSPGLLHVTTSLFLALSVVLLAAELAGAAASSMTALAPIEAAGRTQKDQQIRLLKRDETVGREIAGEQLHRYQVAMSAGQYLNLRLDVPHRWVTLILKIVAPDGEQIVQFSRPKTEYRLGSIQVVAETTGRYVIEVSALDDAAVVGRYELKLVELGPAGEQDYHRAIAHVAYRQADWLRGQYAAYLMPSALENYEGALALYRELGDVAGQAYALYGVSQIYVFFGEYQEGIDYLLNKALPLMRAAGDAQGESQTLRMLGYAYTLSGEHQKALDVLAEGLGRARNLADKLEEAGILTHTGKVLSDWGDGEGALYYFRSSARLRREVGDQKGVAYTAIDVCKVQSSLDDEEKALASCRQALEIMRRQNDLFGQAMALHATGSAYFSMSERRVALGYLEESLLLYRRVGDHVLASQVLSAIGSVYESMGEYQQARERAGEALLLARDNANRQAEATSLYGLARAARGLGDFDAARAHITDAIIITEDLRTSINDHHYRASYFATAQDFYRFQIDLLMQLDKGRPAEELCARAFELSERARARSLLDLLVEAHADVRAGVDPALLARERELAARLNEKAQSKLRFVGVMSGAGASDVIEKQIREIETELRHVKSQIRVASPRYAALTQPQPLSLIDVQRNVLDEDTLLLEYSLDTPRSYLWAVTNSSVSGYELPAADEIEAAARRVYTLLTAPQPRPGESDAQARKRIARADAELPAAARDLSRMILGPAAHLLGNKRLLVVADGALQFIPFAALPVPAAQGPGAGGQGSGNKNQHRPLAPDPRPLIVEHEIVSLPSASSLAVLRRETNGRPIAPKAAVVIADPVYGKDDPRVKASGRTGSRAAFGTLAARESSRVLRSAFLGDRAGLARLAFSREEAEAITNAAPVGDVMQALDFKASRATALNDQLGQYRIVHLAAHGILNTEHPELSGIVLSLVDEKGGGREGFLGLAEVYNLKLPAELVVLSACQTGLGREIKGEGLVGLTRGFMYAGAKRVVASLWNVNDGATAELMKIMYRGILKDGARPAAALRQAQIEMARKARSKNPYHWAGFVIQGEWK